MQADEVAAVECQHSPVERGGEGQDSRIRNAEVRLPRFLGCHDIVT